MKTTLRALGLLAATAAAAQAQFSLTVLHNNDGESQLLSDGGLGGVAEFKTLVDETRAFYTGLGHGVVTISSGDNFLPSPEFQASLETGPLGGRTYYDALAIGAIGYDAVVIGNHDFDAGPEVLADFIPQTGATTYLGANLDFSGVSALQDLVDLGQIAGSAIVTKATAGGDQRIGIIGAATENLPFITSLGDVTVSDVTAAVNAQIAAISGSVDHIVIASHLQGIGEDFTLASNLVDTEGKVRLLIAGGGDELLTSPGSPSPTTAFGASAPVSIVDTGLGDFAGATPDGAYPETASGIPVVTTPGEYGFLGRVTLNFDGSGAFTGVESSSNMQLNEGFTPDASLVADVVTPVTAFVDGLASTVIATTSERLDGNGNRNVIRAREAGLGNLVADGLLAAAQDAASGFGLDAPDLAVANGGGIRDDIEVGDISLKTTFDISPFGNIVSIIEDVTRDDLKLIFENAYSQVADGAGAGIDPVQAGSDTGRFLHVSDGVEVVYDIFAQALVQNPDGTIATPGSRIIDLMVNGVSIVEDGIVQPGETLDLAIVDFLAGGGNQIIDAYLSQAYSFTRVGVSDQQALQAYIEGLAGGDPSFDLASVAAYQNAGVGRIVAAPEPTTALLLMLASLGWTTRRG